MNVLGDIANAMGYIIRWLTKQADGPGPGLKQSQHQFYQGCFPTPVGTDHNHKITGLKSEVDVHQHRLPVVGKIEILDIDNGIAHCVMPRIKVTSKHVQTYAPPPANFPPSLRPMGRQ